MVAFSDARQDFREASQAGLPSPVSIKSRSWPVPTMYVLLPCLVSESCEDEWKRDTL